MTEPKKRTDQQNKALHLWLKMKSDQCREAGVTVQMMFEKTIELEMTPTILKEKWKETQQRMYGTDSTTKLLKGEGQIEEMAEHFNRFFAEEFNLPGLPIPSREKEEFISTLEATKDAPYPENENKEDYF